MYAQLLSHVQCSATPQTIVHQAPLSMRIFRQEYWSRLPFSLPGDLPNPEIQPTFLALKADSLPLRHLEWNITTTKLFKKGKQGIIHNWEKKKRERERTKSKCKLASYFLFNYSSVLFSLKLSIQESWTIKKAVHGRADASEL